MGRKSKVDDTMREEIITAAKAGTDYLTIANRYGIHRGTVSLIACKAGIRRRNMKPAEAADGQPEPVEETGADV